MTNWSRIFEQMYLRIQWLKAFSSINRMAAHRLISKFIKVNFKISDNTLKQQLVNYIDRMPFNNCKELKMITRDLIVFFAKAFTGNSVSQAKKFLNRKNKVVRTFDKVIIAFCSGIVLVLVLTLMYLTFGLDRQLEWETKLGSGIVIYYFFAVIAYIVFAAAVVMRILKRYSINYVFIFEMSQESSHLQLFSISFQLFTIVLFCFVC